LKLLQGRRQLLIFPGLALAAAAAGATGLAYYAGQGLAYLSLVFGALFLIFAARYYVATAAVLLAPGVSAVNGKNGSEQATNGNGNGVYPFISVHLALYNEERVVDRVLTACSEFDYPNYEVVVVDDSNDHTLETLKEWILKQLKTDKVKFKIIHRDNREGFKGGALNEALRNTDKRAEYVVVFDADFVPQPDILKKFVAYFNRHGPNGNGNGSENGNGRYSNGKLAAVQGYQWHTLNRTENWLTRGVSCEFSGSYMVDRTFQEVTGTLKMVAGSVYMIRADLLREYGWSKSITEDWELTLRLYEKGYKVLYTPLVLAPGECPSTLGKLVKQRMRWAEGHTYNVKKHFFPVLLSKNLRLREKLEFLYFAPYYLQSAFLIVGTLFWLTSDVVLGAKLPFWTATVGWGLVFTNLLALPIMSLAGLFMERRARKDFPGIFSQFLLVYALSPYQGYAALKGLLEPVEGSWVRTFKSGKLSGFPGKLEPRKVIKKVLPPKRGPQLKPAKATVIIVFGLSALFLTAFAQGQLGTTQSAQPGYYFYDQAAPPSYSPYAATVPGSSFLMHIALPTGSDAMVAIGPGQGSGPLFFSDPAPQNVALPFGASVSIHVWVEDVLSQPPQGTQGNLKFRIDIYNPANNSITQIPGAGETEVIALRPGVNYYQASWGHIAQGKLLQKGETLVAEIWCPDCKAPPVLLFNSSAHPSNIDFPIEVPENSLPFVALAVAIPGVALAIGYRKEASGPAGEREPGIRRVQRTLIVAGALIILTLPLVITFNDALANLASATGFDRVVSSIVPYESGAVSAILRGFGLPAGASASSVWVAGGFIPVTAFIDWNCAGWQGFVLFGITSVFGLGEVRAHRWKVLIVAAGLAGVFALNVLRISLVTLLGYYVGYPTALLFHDYGGTIMLLAFLLAFWTLMLKWEGKRRSGGE
jgi:exosortase/archaeosortase family protein